MDEALVVIEAIGAGNVIMVVALLAFLRTPPGKRALRAAGREMLSGVIRDEIVDVTKPAEEWRDSTDARLDQIEAHVGSNGGSSLHDRVGRIEDSIEGLAVLLDRHIDPHPEG